MTYVLADITEADHEKIKLDASYSREKLRWLNAAVKLEAFPRTWALDRERNCYLMIMPTESRGESVEFSYLMFVEGRFFKVDRLGAYGGEMCFDEDALPSEVVMDNVKAEVAAAFAVYGAWGEGPLNKRGKIEFDVVPEFIAKGAR